MRHKLLLEQYFVASNARDVSRALKCFADDANICDRGEARQGKLAVQQWMEMTNAKYNTKYIVLNITESGDEAEAFTSISGAFSGSPIMLTFAFTVNAGKISSLKIT